MRRGADARGGAGSGRRCAFGRLPVMNTDVTVQQDCAARRAPEPPFLYHLHKGGRTGVEREYRASHTRHGGCQGRRRARRQGEGEEARARGGRRRRARRGGGARARRAPRQGARHGPHSAHAHPSAGCGSPHRPQRVRAKHPFTSHLKARRLLVRRAHASARVTPLASVTVRLTRLHVMPTASRMSQGVDTRTAETHGCCAALIIFLRLR